MEKQTSPTIVPADKLESVVSNALLSFSSDPMARWSYPAAKDYLNGFHHFIRAFAIASFQSGGVLLSDDGHGCALWLPPHIEPDGDAIVAGFKSTMNPERFEEAMAVVEQMEKFHPKETHWYLPVIAVDPGNDGRGIGTRLMQAGLDRCDRDGLGAYLESSNPVNIPWYERLGFRTQGTIQAAGSPTMTCMFRPPKSPGGKK